MTEYMQLVQKNKDSNLCDGNVIILVMDNDIVKESHITTLSKKDEDLLKGMDSKELDRFINGDPESEYDVFELEKAEYERLLNQNNVGRMRSQLRKQHIDPLEKKENILKNAESKLNSRHRLVKDGEVKPKKITNQDISTARAIAYKKILTGQR